MNTQGGF
eukprot:g12146.t1